MGRRDSASGGRGDASWLSEGVRSGLVGLAVEDAGRGVAHASLEAAADFGGLVSLSVGGAVDAVAPMGSTSVSTAAEALGRAVPEVAGQAAAARRIPRPPVLADHFLTACSFGCS